MSPREMIITINDKTLAFLDMKKASYEGFIGDLGHGELSDLRFVTVFLKST